MIYDERMRLPAGICATPECRRPRKARGFCHSCFSEVRREEKQMGVVPPQRWTHRISDVDATSRTGTCATCGPSTKLISRGNGKWRCYPATQARVVEWKRRRRAELAKELEPECAICGGTHKLNWDHDHATGLYRGTLCRNCNWAVGSFRDDPLRLYKAAEYLRRTP